MKKRGWSNRERVRVGIREEPFVKGEGDGVDTKDGRWESDQVISVVVWDLVVGGASRSMEKKKDGLTKARWET